MNKKEILEYLSSLNKNKSNNFELPNVELNTTNISEKETTNLSELPQNNIMWENINRVLEFTPVGDPSDELKKSVKERDSYKCVRCGLEENKELGVYLHVDHAIPKSKGGQNLLDNLQTLCYDCNVIWKRDQIWFGPTLKNL